MDAERLAFGLTTYVVLLFSLSVHESAHGWMALRMGDTTARDEGRVSLNPIVHIDPIGTLLIPLLQIFTAIPLLGWAKPTPVDGRNFKNPRRGHILVAGAGPVSNMLLALLFTAALFVIVRVGLPAGHERAVLALVETGVFMNIVLAVFNLVPLPPLDGSAIATWGLPVQMSEAYRRVVEPWGSWILLLLFITGALGWLIGPIVTLVRSLLYMLVL